MPRQTKARRRQLHWRDAKSHEAENPEGPETEREITEAARACCLHKGQMQTQRKGGNPANAQGNSRQALHHMAEAQKICCAGTQHRDNTRPTGAGEMAQEPNPFCGSTNRGNPNRERRNRVQNHNSRARETKTYSTAPRHMGHPTTPKRQPGTPHDNRQRYARMWTDRKQART